MKDYFKGRYINISNKARKNIVVAISNIILAKRDKLSPISLDKITAYGKRGKYVVRVSHGDNGDYKDIVGYYDTITSNSQVLEHINDSLPRALKDRWVMVKAGRDGKRFNTNKWVKPLSKYFFTKGA